MENKRIFIDFDGVIYDSEKLVVERKENFSQLTWDEFFEQLNWFDLLNEAKIINESTDYILEAQQNERNIAILTKIHTLLEMEAKVKKIRSLGIEIPIMFVPPHVKKSEIYLPKNGEILIDDSIKNLKDWSNNGGESIYFNENLETLPEYETVNTLKRIL